MKSWKTTFGGALLALGAFFLTQDFALAEIVGTVLNVLGGLFVGGFARDNDVTSEEAGADKK